MQTLCRPPEFNDVPLKAHSEPGKPSIAFKKAKWRLKFKPSLIKELGGFSGRAVHLEHQCLSPVSKSSSLHQNVMGYSFTQTPPPHQFS